MTFAVRLQQAAQEKSLTQKALADASGVPAARVNDYWKGPKEATSKNLFALAEALDVSAEWLALGRGPRRGRLIEVGEADWVMLPEYDLRELTDIDRGPIISTTPFRKDWLYRALGQSADLWLAKLPADYESLELYEGEMVFVQDVAPGEMKDGAVYIFRVHGHLTVARVDVLGQYGSGQLNERRLSFRQIGPGDDQAVPVARIMGVPLKRV